MALSIDAQEKENLEIDLLFEALFQAYGYDFRHYSRASAKRRVLRRLEIENLDSISMLQHQVLHDSEKAEHLLRDLSINVTEMFRDPDFFQSFRQQVLPWLTEQSFFKLWHAGCATGEEVYSMAILLQEASLYDHGQLYATDFNQVAIDSAKQGIFPISRMQLYTQNYQNAGGKHSLADYYHAKYGRALIDDNLKKQLVFAQHNLATDASFGEMQVIICRNVLIYFDRELQENVFQLFTDSLCEGGFLCLGSHETLQHSKVFKHYQPVNEKQRIYRKISS